MVAKAFAHLPAMPSLIRGLLLALLLLIGGQALAHKASDSYLMLHADGARLSGRWDIALRDLDFALTLDRDGDGVIRWGEVEARQAAITAYALGQMTVTSDGRPCPLAAQDLLIDHHSDGAYAVLMLKGACPEPPARITLHYHLFAELDPLHRGLIHLVAQGRDQSFVMGDNHSVQSAALNSWGLLSEFGDFLKTGILHIWSGFDHLLFLISLLLPAVLRREAGQWQPQHSMQSAAIEVIKVVSAFTLAHSLTLSLAALGVVSLPARLTESLIAVSVVLAAINNLYPMALRRVWMVAFAFGLIHGFGFANVLHDLDLPRASLLRALLAFNLGVELGQLVVVALVLPIAWHLRSTLFYTRMVMQAGSLLIALVALFWLVERAFDLSLSMT